MDDNWEEISEGKRLRQRGYAPWLSDQEVITMEIVGESLSIEGEVDWINYTAYEIRIITALVRLGWREEAIELLEVSLCRTASDSMEPVA